MHHRGTFQEAALAPDPVLGTRSDGYTSASLIDASTGSGSQRVAMSQLASGGSIERHFHSYEEVGYVLAGRVELTLGDERREPGADDFVLVQAGVRHAWRNVGAEPARWLEISAPQPKPAGGDFPDTFFGPAMRSSTRRRSSGTSTRASSRRSRWRASRPRTWRSRRSRCSSTRTSGRRT
jgi:quercetin dioxygenase-like cupin family protein